MSERRWWFGGLFWRLTASYFAATLVTALVGQYIGRFEGPFGYLRGSAVVRFFARTWNNVGNSVTLFLVLAVVIGTLTGLLISANLTRRLRRIEVAAAAWGKGDFTAVARVSGRDELGALAADLNRMAGRIQELFTTRQALAVVEERNRLARDLHDSVKQQVFANALLIRAARKRLEQDPVVAGEHLIAAEALSEQTQAELIALIRALRPPALADKGLGGMLREYSDEWSRGMGITVDLRLQGERETPLLIEEALFRVAQEALANVARHSDARSVEISLRWEESQLYLTVRDEGKGFDVARGASKGMGLTSMRERMAAVNGRLRIESSPCGTIIEARVPLREPPPADMPELEEARDG